MPNSYSNIHKQYDKSRAKILSLIDNLGLKINAADEKILEFVMAEKGPNRDIYRDIARDYFNSKYTIQTEEIKTQCCAERLTSFMAK